MSLPPPSPQRVRPPLDAQRLQQLREIFDRAVALAPPERAARLDLDCANDAQLRDEVDSLLRAHESAGGFLETPAAELVAPDPDAGLGASHTGRRIGPYQVMEEIGRGGMGEVYRAVRVDGQYDKQVAIKLVRTGMAASWIIERFRHERQILASLESPYIARLYDGGTTEDGVPYLAMELIDGERIDTYCDRRRLSIGERLRLFRQVCEAVQFAHQRLVIHRDLKPGNILVTTDGVPKLLDFGVAKLLDSAAPAADTTVMRPMTLAYASPEQIRGEPITTASDVYSLGVILYELLTGCSPYRAGGVSAIEVSRAIADTEAQRPSTVMYQARTARPGAAPAARTPETIARARQTTPARLRRQLAGDLDAILLMALRKEPERRYGSVQQLDADVARHLDAVPIQARKGSWRYRARKFVARNTVPVVATAAVIVALVAGLLTASRQATIARAERARAETRFNDVRKLANSLIFDVNDSMADAPGNTAVRKLLLDRAVEYLDKLAQDADGNVDLQRELAWGYQRLAVVQGNSTESNLGQVSAAETSIRKAISLFASVAKAAPNSIPDQLNLAMIHRMMGQSDIYYPGGRPEIDTAIAITDRLLRTDPASVPIKWERALDFQNLGLSQDLAGERAAAVQSLRQSLALEQEVLQGDAAYPNAREGVASASTALAMQLARAGSIDEARRQATAALAAQRALLAQDRRPLVVRNAARAQQYLGAIRALQGELAAAEHDFDEAHESIARLARLDPENISLQWDAVNLDFEKGRLLILSGRYAEAPARLQPALALYAKQPEDDSGPGLGLLHAWLGEMHFALRNYPEALRAYQKSADVIGKDAQYDDARCGVAADYARIGDALLRLNRLEEAGRAYAKALTAANEPFSLAHGDVPALYPIAAAQAGIGDLAMALAHRSPGRTERVRHLVEACASYQQSIDTWRRIGQPALFSPSQFPAAGPRGLGDRLATCRAAVQRGAE